MEKCNGVQHMFDTGKLAPSLFTNNLIDHEFDLRSTHINLVQINTHIIYHHLFTHHPFIVGRLYNSFTLA